LADSYYQDLHLHSFFSFDGKSDIKDYVVAAKAKEWDILGFSEHFSKDADKLQNIYDYIGTINKISLENRFDIRKGLEISLPDIYLINSQIFEELDYIIWSNHEITGDIEKYYLDLLDFIDKNEKIDIIGHIDFPFRFMDLKSSETFDKIKNRLNMIFSLCRRKKIALEFNYQLFNDREKFEIIFKNIWIPYKKAGGKLITMGSDSHNRDDFVKFYHDYNFLRNRVSDFTPVTFKKHRIIYD